MHSMFLNMTLLNLAIWVLTSCGTTGADPQPGTMTDPVEPTDYHQFVLDKLADPPDGSYVMIMAHRGDWKNAPENSLKGIENCIALMLDMTEVDVRRTRDGVLILMHDETLDRTTEGAGLVSATDWSVIKNLRLRNADGSLSSETVPSLEEALAVAKNKMVLFLDKAYTLHNEIHDLVARHGMLKQVIVEGIADWQRYQSDYPDVWQDLNFAARIGAGQSMAYIESHISNPDGRFLFPSCNLLLTQDAKYERVKHSGHWLLFAPLNFTNCSEDFEQNWTWAINQGIDVIITDKPRELLTHLKSQGKHQ